MIKTSKKVALRKPTQVHCWPSDLFLIATYNQLQSCWHKSDISGLFMKFLKAIPIYPPSPLIIVVMDLVITFKSLKGGGG